MREVAARTTFRARNGVSRLTRLRERLCDAEWRRYGYLLIAGKLVGLALVLGAIVFVSSVVGGDVRADEAPVLKGNDIVNPINTMWTLVAAFLVFGMQAASRCSRPVSAAPARL